MQIKCYKKKKKHSEQRLRKRIIYKFCGACKIANYAPQTVSIQYFSLENFRA